MTIGEAADLRIVSTISLNKALAFYSARDKFLAKRASYAKEMGYDLCDDDLIIYNRFMEDVDGFNALHGCPCGI